MDDAEFIDMDEGVQRHLKRLLDEKRARELFAEMEAGDRQPSLNLQLGVRVREQEAPPQLVEGVLPEAALFQVFGETGSYKSFVMLDLALSIANGLEWMGHAVRSPGPVALVLGEGGADAGARLGAWLAAHPGSSDYLLAYSVEQQLDLMLPSHVDAMIADLEEHRMRRHPDQPWRMVVFDTQADHMPSGDEDRAKDFTVVKRSIQRISQATGAAVGLVHHTGWDKSRERGSSRQRQALDVVMQVDNKTITNIKQKSGRLFDPIKFETVERESSLYVRPRTAGEGLAEAAASMTTDLAEAQAVVLGVLQDPTLTARRVMATFSVGHARLTVLLDLLDRLGYDGGQGRQGTPRHVRSDGRGTGVGRGLSVAGNTRRCCWKHCRGVAGECCWSRFYRNGQQHHQPTATPSKPGKQRRWVHGRSEARRVRLPGRLGAQDAPALAPHF